MYPDKIRIWVPYRDSIVRITLEDGVQYHFGHGGQTDEGWYVHSECYEYDAELGVVDCQIDIGGADCDGRQTDHREFCWHLNDETQPMRTVDFQGNVIDLPERGPLWRRGKHYVYDAYAEASGY